MSNQSIYQSIYLSVYLPGPPKKPKIIAQYSKIESIGSIGSTILAILEVQVHLYRLFLYLHQTLELSMSISTTILKVIYGLHKEYTMVHSRVVFYLLQDGCISMSTYSYDATLEARKLEYDCPRIPKQKQEHQHTSPSLYIPTLWSLL